MKSLNFSDLRDTVGKLCVGDISLALKSLASVSVYPFASVHLPLGRPHRFTLVHFSTVIFSFYLLLGQKYFYNAGNFNALRTLMQQVIFPVCLVAA